MQFPPSVLGRWWFQISKLGCAVFSCFPLLPWLPSGNVKCEEGPKDIYLQFLLSRHLLTQVT